MGIKFRQWELWLLILKMRVNKLGISNKNFLNFSSSKLTSYTKRGYISFMENLVPSGTCPPGLCWHHWGQHMVRLSLPWLDSDPASQGPSSYEPNSYFLHPPQDALASAREEDCGAHPHRRARSFPPLIYSPLWAKEWRLKENKR